MLMSATDFAFHYLLWQKTDVPCTSVQILLSCFSCMKMYVWQVKSGQEVPLLLVKARIDTSSTEIWKPTFMVQFEEYITKIMPRDPISHLLSEAEYYLYVNIFSCLILTGESA